MVLHLGLCILVEDREQRRRKARCSALHCRCRRLRGLGRLWPSRRGQWSLMTARGSRFLSFNWLCY